MNKFLAFVLLACLVAEVSAGCLNLFGHHKKPKNVDNEMVEHGQEEQEDVEPPKEVDFDALNDYLRQKLEDVDDPAANLALLKENINSLEGGAKKAGQMVLELANNGDECNNNIMLILEQIDESNLNMKGYRRIEKVLKKAHRKAMKVCAKHIEQSYGQADSSLAKFWSEFNPTLLWDNMFYYKPRVLGGNLVPLLERMSKGDPEALFKYYVTNKQTGQQKTVKDPERFEYAINTYVLKPCERAVSDDLLLDNILGKILSLAKRIKIPVLVKAKNADYQNEEKRELNLGEEIDTMSQIRDSCRQLLEMSPEVRASFIRYA